MSDRNSHDPRPRPQVSSRNPYQQYQSLPQRDLSCIGTMGSDPRALRQEFGRHEAIPFPSTESQPLRTVQALPQASARALMPPPPPRPARRAAHQPSAPPHYLMPPPPPRPRHAINQKRIPPHQLMPPIPSRPLSRSSTSPHNHMRVDPSRSSPRSSLPQPSVSMRQNTATLQMRPRVFGPTSMSLEARQTSSGAAVSGLPDPKRSESKGSRHKDATGRGFNSETTRTDSAPSADPSVTETLYTRDIELLIEVVENAMYDLACLEEGRTRYQGMNESQIRTHIHKTIEDGQHKITLLERELRIMGIPFHPVDQKLFNPRPSAAGGGPYQPANPRNADELLNSPSNLLLFFDGVGPGYEGASIGCSLKAVNKA